MYSDNMFIATYYKIADRWYLDDPEYTEKGGKPEYLERVGGIADLLERASQGQSSVKLALHTEPFEGAEEAVLIGSSGDRTGAYYLLHSINGEVVDLEIWVNEFIYRHHKELPPKIYGKFL